MKDMEYAQPALDAAAKALGMKSRGQVAANRMEYWIAIAFLVVFVCVRNLGYGWSLVGLGGIVAAGEERSPDAPCPRSRGGPSRGSRSRGSASTSCGCTRSCPWP